MNWTRERQLDALRKFAEKHGRAPTSREWFLVGDGSHPTRHTVVKTFGSWNAGIEEAELSSRRPGGWRPRPTACPKGHPYTPENTLQNRSGVSCRTCDQQRRKSPEYLAYARAYRESTAEHGREYRRKRHQADPEPNRERIRRWVEENEELRAAMRAECRALIRDAKGNHCWDCGGWFPSKLLAFHHRDPSSWEFYLGRVTIRRREAILAEIAKCDVLCHKCHSGRHKALRLSHIEAVERVT